ncbi:MAG: hypothetical protein JWO25_1984 [Alphaproteobacteria bacterium]|nr:hypothetical protein [Alphaproteobacteria bacterium]MDB5722519.1 hypothetical protein [Alphaproteobacteria bacterium]
MFSVRNSALTRSLVAAALAASAGAACADILVLRADGPSARSFPPGRRLADNARLVLKASDELIVLDGRGTRMIRGPGNFIAGVTPPARIASAEPVLQRRARIGAVRGVPSGPPRPGSIWEVDVAKSSNVCVADPSKIRLWRSDPSTSGLLTVTRLPDGASRQLRWDSGVANLAWPDGFAIADHAQYRLGWAGQAAPANITFRALAQPPSGMDGTATALLANNCTAQLDLFIDAVRSEDNASG